MNTTPLRIEFLILGFQALLCVYFFVAPNAAEIAGCLRIWKDFSLVLGIIVFGAVYSLGTFVDALSSSIELFIRYRIQNKPKNSYKSDLWLEYPETASQINSRYFDLRIMRGTALNLFVLTIALFIGEQEEWTYFISGIAFLVVGYTWYLRREILVERLFKVSEAAASKK